MDKTDLVLATDGSAYQNWQCEVFQYSMQRAGQRGRYVEIINTSADKLTYPTHNRIKAMKRYLETSGAESIWMMDPDMIFVGRLEMFPREGMAIGEPIRKHWWAEITAHEGTVRKRFSRAPSRELSFTQVPWIITRDDLSRIIERWDELIYEVYHDEMTVSLPGWNRWVTTSWCYWLVLAEFGIAQRVLPLAHFACEDDLRLPVIHYPHKMRAGFYKRNYKPWESITIPDSHRPICERVTLETINEYARTRGSSGQ